MKTDRKTALISCTVASCLVALIVAGRLLPHPPNFAPVAAAALFAGFFFKNRLLALAVPVAGMLVSDAYIGFYNWKIMAVVYFFLAAPITLGFFMRKPSLVRVASSSLAGSLLFFLASNLAVWAFGPFYQANIDGLTACLAAGIPFFKYTVVGDLFWCSVIFGSYAVATSSVLARAGRREAAVSGT